jgi:hypothetical protein
VELFVPARLVQQGIYALLSLLAALTASPFIVLSAATLGGAQALEGYRLSGPLSHANLAVYFIHGKSTLGKVPLTLEEAMAKGAVKVRETSNVNQLDIENLGLAEVFVQPLRTRMRSWEVKASSSSCEPVHRSAN